MLRYITATFQMRISSLTANRLHVQYLCKEFDCVTQAESLNTQRHFSPSNCQSASGYRLIHVNLRYLIYANHVLTNAQRSSKLLQTVSCRRG